MRSVILALVVGVALGQTIPTSDPVESKSVVPENDNVDQLADLQPSASDDMLALATGYGHSKKSGKGHKGVKGHSEHSGHKSKKAGKKHEDHWSKHSNDKGKHSKGHHDSKKYHGDHHKASKGHKGAKFGKKGHKHKGHVTKGFKNTYHKNEFSKKTKFYDSFDNGGYHKKYGGYKGKYGGSKGNKFKGGKLSGFFKGGKFGKKHELEKGKHFDEHKGHKGHYEEKGNFGHKSAHGKGHRHDHGYGHSRQIPTYIAPNNVQRRNDQDDVSGRKPLDEYDEDYGDYNGYDEALEEEQRNEGRQVSPDYEENDGQQDQEQDKNTDHANYHKNYFPREELYEMVGGFLANHHPPTETNFNRDHSELENHREKPDGYLYDSSEDDDAFIGNGHEDERQEKEREHFEPESRQEPAVSYEVKKTSNLIPNAFKKVWSGNPEKEISKQVLSYFRNDDNDHNTFRVPLFEPSSRTFRAPQHEAKKVQPMSKFFLKRNNFDN